jgi:small membrane protein
MLIQIILIAAIVVIGILVIRNPGSDSHLAIRRLLLFGFVIVAVLSVLFPQWLSWVASLIGVGRGTDLLLYALVLVVLVVIATQYRTNVEQNRRITQLARRIALLEARERERTPASSGDTTLPPDRSDAPG